MTRTLRIGTRSSPLARWQADWVSDRLREAGRDVELVLISTTGDQNRQGPIGAIGTQGVFTKEIQRALLDDRVDIAVHSLKDLPTERVEGLSLTAVPPRGPVGDVLVAREAKSFDHLPWQAVVGTGSLRRRAQLLHARSDLVMRDIRGNVETRLQKLANGEYDAIVLAEAGITRLGLAEQITQPLPFSLVLPAVGQGALGIEIRDGDADTTEAVVLLNDADTLAAATAERAMLATLRGGCLAPVAGWGRVEAGKLKLTGAVLSVDGKERRGAEGSSSLDEARQLGEQIAADLLAQGAGDLIAAAKGQ